MERTKQRTWYTKDSSAVDDRIVSHREFSLCNNPDAILLLEVKMDSTISVFDEDYMTQNSEGR